MIMPTETISEVDTMELKHLFEWWLLNTVQNYMKENKKEIDMVTIQITHENVRSEYDLGSASFNINISYKEQENNQNAS